MFKYILICLTSSKINFTKGILNSWKEPEISSAIISYLRQNMKDAPKRITQHKIAQGYFQLWLRQLQYKDKVNCVALHPGLTMEDRQLIDNILQKHKTRSLQWAVALTFTTYLTYFFGLRHRHLFYIFARKNPSIIFSGLRRIAKYFVIPLTVYNVSYGIVLALMKEYSQAKIKEAGLYKKYHLEYIIESKPF